MPAEFILVDGRNLTRDEWKLMMRDCEHREFDYEETELGQHGICRRCKKIVPAAIAQLHEQEATPC